MDASGVPDVRGKTMRTLFPEYYRPSPDEFEAKFKECVFAFDTNILLNLYRYKPESRKSFLNVLRKEKVRIWLPHRVAFEYHRNRVSVLLGEVGLVETIAKIVGKA